MAAHAEDAGTWEAFFSIGHIASLTSREVYSKLKRGEMSSVHMGRPLFNTL